MSVDVESVQEGARGDQRSASDSLDLELLLAVSGLICVFGIELGISGRAEKSCLWLSHVPSHPRF